MKSKKRPGAKPTATTATDTGASNSAPANAAGKKKRPGKTPAPAVTPSPEPSAKPKQAKQPKAKAGARAVPAAAADLPSILFQGDTPAPPGVSGPGQRYVLGPTAPVPPADFGDDVGELPEAYGTKKLLLVARDPHWLYAHWDLTNQQLREYNSLAADRHLVLRVYEGSLGGTFAAEVHVHPESRNWFIHVGRGGTRYVAELGYYQASTRAWARISGSTATLTPPDQLSEERTVQFATIPVDVPFAELVALVRTPTRESLPLAQAISELQAQGLKGLPSLEEWTARPWSPAQEQVLAQVLSMDSVRRVWIGSLEITELLRRKLADQRGSAGFAEFSLPTSPMGALGSVSSPFGAAERPRGFWFNVNAELIIYGATEPTASVTLAGKLIKLRPDGTFAYRFALPDGAFPMPAVATSADGGDRLAAELQFTRSTAYRGDVGTHPQDKNLKPPTGAAVS
jgi:uncharacterized protein